MVGGLSHGQLTKRSQVGFSEEMLHGAACFIRSVDDSAFQTMQQRAGRDVHHHHLSSLPHHPVRHGLAHANASDVPDLIVEALDVLNIHTGQNVDTSRANFHHILPSLDAGRAGGVGVRELVHSRHLRLARDHAFRVHVFEDRAAILVAFARYSIETFGERNRVLAGVRLEICDRYIMAEVPEVTRLREHLVSLAYARRISEKDLKLALPFPRPHLTRHPGGGISGHRFLRRPRPAFRPATATRFSSAVVRYGRYKAG